MKRKFNNPGLNVFHLSRRIRKIGSWNVEVYFDKIGKNPVLFVHDEYGYFNFPIKHPKKGLTYDYFNIPPVGVRNYLDQQYDSILKDAKEYYEKEGI